MKPNIEKDILECFKTIVLIIKLWLKDNLCKNKDIEYKISANGKKEEVSFVDKKIDQICYINLTSNFPEIPIFSEERFSGDYPILDSEWVFIIDPVDGTSELLQGSDYWSVSLAAINKGVSKVGLLFMPNFDLILWCTKGKGIWLNDRKLDFSSFKSTGKIATSPRQILISEIKKKLNKSQLIPIPIPAVTPKIIALIRGQVDAAVYYPQIGKSAKVWDYAAAALLVEESNGMITSFDGKPLPFRGKEVIHKGGWLATNNTCMHKILLGKIS